MGANVQVCWEKFCRYWDVEPRVVPMDGDRYHLDAATAAAAVDEDSIGVVAILGSTFDGSYEPVAEIAAALDDVATRTGVDVPIHVDGASGGMIAPFLDPDLEWDFRLERVVSINTSGHKYGLVYPGVGLGAVARRRAAAARADLQRQLPRWPDADVRVELLAAGCRGSRAVLHLLPARTIGLSRGPAGLA